jgi:hypothetical protein
MLGRVMLAGVPVQADAVAELADTVRATGADELADRLERALADDVALLALRRVVVPCRAARLIGRRFAPAAVVPPHCASANLPPNPEGFDP